jgi:hypothetical protein
MAAHQEPWIMQPQPNPNDLLFETLCFYRGLYAMQGRRDRETAMSIDAAVVYGEGLLRVARRRDEHAARRITKAAD